MVNWEPLEVVEDWWNNMDIDSKKALATSIRVRLNISQWKLQDWENAVNYYIINEVGDPKGYQKT